MPRRHHINPPLNIYRKIALTFIVVVAVLIGVIFYFTMSFAYINVYPVKQEVKTDFNFIVVEDSSASNPEEGIFTGKVVNEIIEAEKVWPATGSKILAGDTLGKVKIFNNLDRPQILVATTRLLTPDNILFRIKNRVEIPARGSLDTVAYPDDTQSLLPTAGTKFTIPGLSSSLQDVVYAQAVEDFVAAGNPVKVVSQEDFDNALRVYTDELALQAITNLNPDLAKVLKKEILSQTFSNQVNDQVSEFKLKLKIQVTGVAFDKAEIANYALNVLKDTVPVGRILVSANSDNLIFEVEKIDSNNHLAQVKSTNAGFMIISEDNSIFDKDKFKNMSPDEIKTVLSSLEEIEMVEVKMFPGFLKKMPFFTDHIIIKVNE